MGRVNRRRIAFYIFLSVLGCFILSSLGAAQEDKNEKDLRPERGIAIYTEYANVTVPKGESVKMDLILENKGRTDEAIDVRIPIIPKGWKASLKGENYLVSGIYVPDGKTKNLSLVLEPDKSIGPGVYVFQFDAKTADDKFTATHKLMVNVRERIPGADDIQITTSYPVLRGQTDATFEFSLDVLNKSELDRMFNISAVAPEKWEVNFKPAYEQKQISSFLIKGGQSQSVAVQVNPPKDALAGEYPILVRVSSREKRAEVKLTVALTGIYKLDAGTPTGVTNLEAMPGKPSNVSIFIKNTGSAVNRNIHFSSFKPEKWEVSFNPEKIEAIDPDALKQVEVIIKPAQQSSAGDYSVGVVVDGEKGANKTIDFRVTVKTSTAWGWIWIGVIILVVAGLSTLFIWMRRR